MEIKDTSIGQVAFENGKLIGFRLLSFSKIAGSGKKTLRSVLNPLEKGGYAPAALQHLSGNIFLKGFKSTDKYLKAEAVDDLLAYLGGDGANKFRKPQARAASAKLAEFGGFVSFVYHELGQQSSRVEDEKVVSIKPKEETPFLGGAKLNLDIDWEQYKRDAEQSKEQRLPPSRPKYWWWNRGFWIARV